MEDHIYTIQDLRDSVRQNRCLVAVRGYVYDLSKFKTKHPGGLARLLMAAGRDATVVFETTHGEGAELVLRKYRVGRLEMTEFPIFHPPNEFARTLRKRVKEYFESQNKDPKYSKDSLWRYFWPIAGIFICYWQIYWNSAILSSSLWTHINIWVWAWAYFGFTVFWVHDASHASITHSPLVWDTMGHSYNFIMGFSDKVWFYRHVLGHHPFTNIVDVDPDISVKPFSVTRFLPSQKWSPSYRLQHVYAPALYSLLTHFSRLQDILALVKMRTDSIELNPFTQLEKAVFWTGKVIFFQYRLVIPIIFSPSSAWRVFYTFILTEMATSCIAAYVFQSNHVVEDVKWYAKPASNEVMPIDWTELQVATAQDYGHGNAITTFLTGALNYQVVHHIFPHINQSYYPDLARILKRTSEEFGIVYNIRTGWLEAFAGHLQLLRRMGRNRS